MVTVTKVVQKWKRSKGGMLKKVDKEIRKITGDMKIPKRIQLGHTPIPQSMMRTFCTVTESAVTIPPGGIAGNPADFIYRGNGFSAVGPSINYPVGTRGGFTANFPTGLTYFLGSAAANASSGMYGRYIIHKSKIVIEVIPITVSVLGVIAENSSPLNVILTAQHDDGLAYTYTTNQVSEFPLTKRNLVPQVLNTVPKRIVAEYSTKQVLKSGAITGKDQLYGGSYNSNPAQSAQWNWFLRLSNANNSMNEYNCIIRAQIYHYAEMYEPNVLSTAAPT